MYQPGTGTAQMQYVFTLYTLYRWCFPSHFQGAGPAEPWNTGFTWSSWRDAWDNTLHKNWLGCQGRRHCDAPLHSCSWALRVIGEGRRDPGHVRATSFQGHALSSDAAKLFSMCLHGHMGCDLCHLAPRQGNPACSSLPPVTSFGRCVSFFTAAKAAPTTGMN